MEKAHKKFVSKEWSPKQVSEFLRVYCLNTDAINEIKACAANCLLLQEASERADEEEMAILAEERAREPEKFEAWTPPISWGSGIDLHQFSEIAMHHLFKGVLSSLISNIQDWCARQRKYEEFTRRVRPMTDLCRDLRLPWLKIEPYVGKELGGWVSENYVAFARIMPWCYAILADLERELYQEPEKPQNMWTKNENTEWLKLRGLPTHGNFLDIRSRVAQHIRDGPPPILPPGGGSVDAVEKCVRSLYQLLSYLMGMKVGGEEKANCSSRLIRIYLTHLFDFDENMKKIHKPRKSGTQFWLGAYNHVCLLNIPLQLKWLGPLRNRWEGKYMGEGFLSVVKPTLPSSNRKNWTRNLMVNLFRQRAMLVLKKK